MADQPILSHTLCNLVPPNGGGEQPAEPVPTPAENNPMMSVKVNGDAVDEKLEEIREEGQMIVLYE
ncbi:hypothetical protein CALVIDRAFT_560583 [Calocera viscosa TUFC12733]|uniref:Uncharacterized protein n=1 Tax=Calocera viscosa (strain TUFC12733) TaxID=1330018 RepID=A0A167R748_CALVF|nr:hypothetical protein CALVIDRAFT_560583 [Calocera viscosa TUFC12733]